MPCRLILLLVGLEIVAGYGYDNNYNSYAGTGENHRYCDDLSPYFSDINLEQISGVWYGVEKIEHSKGVYNIQHTNECFYIDIKERNIQPTPPTPYPVGMGNSPYPNRAYGLVEHYRIRHFVLEWHHGQQDDYHIKVNTSRKGFWQTDLPDRSVASEYTHFGGVIQVLRQANNYLVLNFCMRLPYSQFYSVVLARNENQLTPQDLTSIHDIFSYKQLSTSSLKRVCENAADRVVMSSVFVVTLYLLWLSR